MPSILVNNANGGVDGATALEYNSGGLSGVAIQQFWTDGTATTTYESAHARAGGLCYKLSSANSSAMAVQSNTFVDTDTIYIRFYVYIDENPPGSTRICDIMNRNNNVCWGVGVRNDRSIVVRDGADDLLHTFTLKMPLKQWVRFEIRCTSGVGNAQSTIRMFTEADSPYPAEVRTSSSTITTRINDLPFAGARFGFIFPLANYTMYLDDIGFSDTNYLGPANPQQVIPLEYHNTADMGLNGVNVTRQNSGTSTDMFFSEHDSLISPSSLTFSSEQAMHGTLSYKYVSAPMGARSFFGWKGLATRSLATRSYVYFTAVPTASAVFHAVLNYTSGEDLFKLIYTTTSRLAIQDHAATLWTSTASLLPNTWYRVESFLQIGETATSCSLTVSLYLGDATEPVDSYSTSAATFNLEGFGRAWWGKINASGVIEGSYYFDSLAVKQNASGFIGPHASVPAAVNYNHPGIVPHLGWGVSL